MKENLCRALILVLLSSAYLKASHMIKFKYFPFTFFIHEAVKYWYNLALAFSLYLKQPKDLPCKSGIEGLETEKFTRDHQYSLVKVAR